MNITRAELLKYLAWTGATLAGRFSLGLEDAFTQTASITYGPHPALENFVFGARDWSAKYQLRTSVQWFNNGGESNQALIAGKIDGNSPGAGPIVAINSVLPGKFPIAMVWSYGDYSATVVRPDSPYQSMADLKGKKVGVLVGSGAYLSWLVYLEANGLRLDDFLVVNMSGEDIPAALSAKVIDAGTVWDPYVAIMEHKNIGRILALFGKWVYDVAAIQFRSETIVRNRPAVVRLVAAAMDVQDFIRNHPDEAARLASAEMAKRGIDVPWQAFEVVMKKRLVFKPDVSEPVKTSLTKLGQVALKLGRIKRPPSFTFATDILEEAKRLRK